MATQSPDNDRKGASRRSGILLHVTSLPAGYGIGDLGPAAQDLIHRLRSAGQTYWQMLPVTPTGYADSPYQSPSAFAGNPMLISPEILIESELVTADDARGLQALPDDLVDYRAVIDEKNRLLIKAASAFRRQASSEQVGRFAGFRESHGEVWLDEGALFTAIKDSMGGVAWNEWPEALAHRDPEEMRDVRRSLRAEIEGYQIIQFLFFEQWRLLREISGSAGVGLVGDIPLYVAHDSADVWANPGNYLLDDDREPVVVAGVPPDYFSESGQRWGNPIYDWDRMTGNGFNWWRQRMGHVLSMFDVVRIDHFRGIAGYWAIPAGEKTAVVGEWREGPGGDLLDAIGIEPGSHAVVAEDLGIITPDVDALRDEYRLPGMRVAQFGFDAAHDTPLHHPDAYQPRAWAYTGTHDNNTTEGWFWENNASRDPSLLGPGRKRLHEAVGEPVSWGLIEMVARSLAGTTIFPVQDLLGLGAEARMNTPGTTEGNWRWRLGDGELTGEMMERLGRVTAESGRDRMNTP